MSVKIIQDRLRSFGCQSVQEEEHALREITQELALVALSRTDFYNVACFHGGTCLRIFYGLNRFSEDLDFALKQCDQHFALDHYLKKIALELEAFGYQIEIADRSTVDSAVKKAFIKDDSLGKILKLQYLNVGRVMSKIRIKLEVDTRPPMGSGYENKYLDFPFLSAVTVHDLPSLFAGKIHALLCREYIKGRDWYDFLWYAGRSTKINLELLASSLEQSGPWAGQRLSVDESWCCQQLRAKIESMDWPSTRQDVQRFVKPNDLAGLDLWTKELFLDRLDRLRNL